MHKKTQKKIEVKKRKRKIVGDETRAKIENGSRVGAPR